MGKKDLTSEEASMLLGMALGEMATRFVQEHLKTALTSVPRDRRPRQVERPEDVQVVVTWWLVQNPPAARAMLDTVLITRASEAFVRVLAGQKDWDRYAWLDAVLKQALEFLEDGTYKVAQDVGRKYLADCQGEGRHLGEEERVNLMTAMGKAIRDSRRGKKGGKVKVPTAGNREEYEN